MLLVLTGRQWNTIGDDGCFALADAVECNHALTEIDLGVRYAQMLQIIMGETGQRHVEIAYSAQSNPVTFETVAEFECALEYNSSLVSLSFDVRHADAVIARVLACVLALVATSCS